MRFGEVFRFELGYTLRRPTTWAYFAALAFLAFVCIPAGMGDGGQTHVNTPHALNEFSMVLGTFGMVVTAALFGDAAIRDVEVSMEALLFTSGLGKGEYLWARFLAAFVVNALVFLMIPLSLAISTLIYRNPQQFGPFQPMAYVQPFLMYVLPNMTLVGAILFTIGLRTRQILMVFLGGIGVIVVCIVFANYHRQFGNPVLSIVADPLGIATTEEMVQYWTTVEQNTRLYGFPPTLLLNRAIWLAVAATVLLLLHRSFRFAHAGGEGRRKLFGRKATVTDPGPERAAPVTTGTVPRVAGTFGARTRRLQVLAVVRNSLEEVVGSRIFLGVLLAGVGFTLLWGWNVGTSVFETSTWPVTHLVVSEVMGRRVIPIIWLFIAAYAGELVWKDRSVGVEEIADAAPVPEGVVLLGRFIALVAILTALHVAILVGGLLIQALQGYYQFEFGLFLRMIGMQLAGYVLFAALAMTIHVLVNQKYVGHIVVLAAFGFTMAAPILGIRHHLLIYGTDPGITYSDMNGFGPFLAPFAWFKLYWSAWALLLGVLATLFVVRGREPGVRERFRQARARFIGPVARTAGVAAVLILLLGGFIFYNTNILNEYSTPTERAAVLAEYERRYKRFEQAPQPEIVAADLRIEIRPEAPAIDLGGTYHLVNKTDVAIDSVHVLLDRSISVRSMSFDRPATDVLVDEAHAYRIFALERPLAAGDTLRLTFDVALHPRGFPNSGIQTSAVANGTHFNRRLLPFIGYQPFFELSGDDAREEAGLAPQRSMPAPGEAGQFRYSVRDGDFVQANVVIGTAVDQVAVTPGVLRRSWTENGRRYFRYETEVPTAFGATVFSGKYAMVEDRWNDIDLAIYHHPGHDRNLDNQMRSMKASLAYFTEQFGPYPASQLRIVEFARYGGFGVAHPHTIAFSEEQFLNRVQEGDIDQAFYGVAHEVGHQWWGGQVRGGVAKGHALLSESLANYSATIVTERTFGAADGRRIYDTHMERYLMGRSRQAREVPLLEIEDQSYLAYRKGAIAMLTMRDHIGEERVNTALRRMVEKHGHGRPPYPSSLDLYAELRAVTPDSLHPLLGDLFAKVTLWEVKTTQGRAEPTDDGAYRVTLEVVGRKVHADREGTETEVSMDDLVEIGVFAPPTATNDGEPLYLQRHRIRSGVQTITVTVPRAPARAGVDPYNKMIDRRRDDNVVDVGTTGTGAGR
jgi:ABC-2 type transport system permease protein